MLISCLTCGAPYENNLNQCPYCGGHKTNEKEALNSNTNEIDKLFKLALFDIKNQNHYAALTNINEIIKIDPDQNYAWFLKIKCELISNYNFNPKQAHQFDNNREALKKFVDNCEHYLSEMNSENISIELGELICKILDSGIIEGNNTFIGLDTFIYSLFYNTNLVFGKDKFSDIALKIPQNKLIKYAYASPSYFGILLLQNNLLPQEDLIKMLNKDFYLLLPYIKDNKTDYINQFIRSKNDYFINEINDDYYKENLTKRERINNEIKSFPSNFINEFKNCEIDSVEIQKSLDYYFTVIKNLENPKGGGKCFIATAAMGDYNHPIVIDLRLFRDNWLIKRKWGIKFTNWYYTYGAKAAKVIEKSTFLKKLVYIFIVKPLQIITKKLR
jgi:hypothetical protein